MTTTMPALIGSVKQVAWAEKLRSEWVAWQTSVLARSEKDLARELKFPSADQDDLTFAEEWVAENRAALAAAERQTSAAFWIESRSAGFLTIAKMLREGN